MKWHIVLGSDFRVPSTISWQIESIPTFGSHISTGQFVSSATQYHVQVENLPLDLHTFFCHIHGHLSTKKATTRLMPLDRTKERKMKDSVCWREAHEFVDTK